MTRICLVRYLLLVGSFLSVCSQSLFSSQERIISFDSDITVHADSSLTVHETIKVLSAGESIVHGIFREFPEYYKASLGSRCEVVFRELSVTLDDQPVPYFIEIKRRQKIKRIFMGTGDKKAPLGIHTYNLVYTMDRQIGFFKNHDELYLNVTGNGWRLPIEHVRAIIHLPAAAQGAYGYTGFQGQKGDAYTSITEGNSALFSSTHYFSPGEGFTIAVTWQKGCVQKSPLFEEFWWFLKDNWALVGVFFGFIFLLFLLLYVLVVTHRANAPGVIVPVFYPPQELMPSAVGYMKSRRWKTSLFAADIVAFAIRGFLTIEHKKTFWGRSQYSLSKTEKNCEELNEDERFVLKALFLQGKKFVINSGSKARLRNIQRKLKHVCTNQVKKYIKDDDTFIRLGGKTFLVMLILSVSIISFVTIGLLLGAAGLLLIINCYRYTYTAAGRKLQDAIDGFELYLATEKKESAQYVETPLIKMFELHEKYVPYAIALGVEMHWERQFITVFNSFSRASENYSSTWFYSRGHRTPFRSSLFGASFDRAISVPTFTRSYSGARGRGSSGGGGGSSGGGGW